MRRIFGVMIIIYWSLCAAPSPYAQTIPVKPYEPLPISSPELKDGSIKPEKITIGAEDMVIRIKKMRSHSVDRKTFGSLYNKPKIDEEKAIRGEWSKVFGIDVWRPYYKAKDVEKWVKRKCSVKVFKLKGEPQFEKNRATYAFTTKF